VGTPVQCLLSFLVRSTYIIVLQKISQYNLLIRFETIWFLFKCEIDLVEFHLVKIQKC